MADHLEVDPSKKSGLPLPIAAQLSESVQAERLSEVPIVSGAANASVYDADLFGSTTLLTGRDGEANPGFAGGGGHLSAQEHGFMTGSGMYGSLQGLLHSFTSRMPAEECIGTEDIDFTQTRNDNYEPSSVSKQVCEDIGTKVGADGYVDTTESPIRIDADDSGYESSDSSLYDVNSDDENYEIDPSILGGEVFSVEENLASFNECPAATEEPSANIEEDGSGDNDEQAEPCPCMAGNPFMHVMTNLSEGETEDTTWKRRNKRSTTKREDCRVSKGMSPIEIALRNAPNRTTKYIFQPVLGITFDCENEAFEFYNMYSWEVGFGIKKDTLITNSKGTKTRRDLRCICSGHNTKAEYKTKKTNCKAMIRLLRSDDDGWYIAKYVAEHNHLLTDTCGQTKQWPSHRELDACAVDMIKYLRENNVSLTKVHCIMGSMFGTMDNIPITKTSMRAICRRIARDQMDDDVKKTLNIFQEIRKKDPGFQFSVDPGENNQIKNLLWINGKSRDQYKCFGDVITFDTTYCTNIYKMPFGLFVGVNNHFQTTVFGGVFMKDETIPSFKWVFSEFLSLMGGKLPQTVFTDQCAAMAAALKDVWKGAKHLLCKWHIFKDARAKLGPIYRKGSPFRKLFHKIINDMLTVDEFERAWAYMLERFGLQENQYLKNIYRKREQWAKGYFKGCFCARMASTQRSESANHMLKRFVPRNCSMNRFVVQYNKLLFDRNEAEDRAEFDTKIFKNVRDRAWPVEEHAMKFYTSAAYGLLRKEIGKSTDYFAREKAFMKEYEIVHVKPNKKHPWGREKFTVVVNNEGESYSCECGLYQHFGILCSHVLRVFLQVGVYEIPKAHIHKRWTRDARDILPEGLNGYQQDNLCMKSMTYRHSYLYVNAMGVVQEGNRDLGAFEIVSKELKNIQKKLREYYKTKEKIAINGFKERIFMQATDCTTESDACVDSGAETGEEPCNTYGAAGSSAWMSDSELLQLRAPAINRPAGRPRETRFKGKTDYYGKKQKKNGTISGTKRKIITDPKPIAKRRPRCGKCSILGHTATQCTDKPVDTSTELPEF